jgi:PAS domain S-box-containing protein
MKLQLPRALPPALPFVVVTGSMLVAYNLLAPDSGGRGAFYCAIEVAAAAALLLGTLLRGVSKSWVLLALSLGAWSAGDIIWFLAEVNGPPPYPSISDLFYLIGYVLLAAGLLGAVTSGRRRRAAVADLIDVAIIALSIAMATWSVTFEPTFAEGWSAAAGFTGAYAGGDILLIAILTAIYLNPQKRTDSVVLLGAGVMAVFLADVTYYVPFFAASPSLENWSNHSWLLGYILIGTAGLQRGRRGKSESLQTPPGLKRLLLVGLFLVSMPSAIALQALFGDGFHTQEMVVFSVAFALVIALILARGALLIGDVEAWRKRNDQTRLRFQTVFESAGLGIVIADGDYVTEANQAFQSMLGYTARELAGTSYYELVHPDERAAVRASTERGPGRRTATDRRYIHRDGSTVLGRVTLTTAPDERLLRIAVIEDITQKAAMERAVLDATTDAIRMIDLDGRTVLVNAGMRRLGAELAEGESFWDVTAELAARTSDPVAQLATLERLAADPEREAVDSYQVAASGVWLQRYSAPVRDTAERIIGRIFVIRDVTEEHNAQQLKSDLVATVSHELRTPLTGILGFAELLAMDDLEEDSRRGYIETIRRESIRLRDLINDFLDLQRIEEGNFGLQLERVDMRGLLLEQASLFEGQSEAHAFELSLEDGIEVCGESDRVAQVIANLFSNAIKYSPDGGVVSVRAWVSGATVRVEVEDKGIGIAPDDQRQIFEKFFRADSTSTRRIGGTGLGLALSRDIVEAHGGTIGFCSAEGEGTTFWFELPSAGEGAESVPAEALRAPVRELAATTL